MYQPKLYLRFDPPIQNDSVGINQLDKILGLIENEYPETTWFEGQSPVDFNPFNEEDEDRPDQVTSLTIGHWLDKADTITYGPWDDNDMGYQNGIDGWQWLKDREVDYDQTSEIFSNLNENEEEIPKVTYVFEPPIEDEEILRHVMHILNTEHPGLEWVNGVSVLTYDIYNEVFDRNDAGVVGALSIGFFPEEPNQLSWSSWVDPDENWGPKVDGWSLIKKYSIPNTEDVFNQLNESTYQPKLNLRFDEPIYDADELDKVLRVLEMTYPGLQWMGGNSITTHNVIRDGAEEHFEYEPIYYLTIGFFPTSSDKLTYTSAPDDDRDFADDEHHNFKWVDGWQWVRDNEVDYDQTSDIFSSLNESEEEIPKVTYVFEPPIEDKETLRNVLYVIGLEHPGVMWFNNKPILNNSIYREIFDDNEGYDFVGGLTIYPEKDSDIITWTSWVDPRGSYSDYGPKVDGWQWVKDNEVNYDETTDIFNQLNESYDFLGQTNLTGFKFKKTIENNPKLWVIRTVMNDDGKELYFKYDFSDTTRELLGSPDIYGGNLPQYGDMPKEKVINLANNGDWEIIDMPTTDTESIFNQLN